MRALQMLLSSVLCFWSVSLFASDNTNEPAQQDTENHTPVRGSIISGLLQNYDNPFVLYPYEPNYIIYTYTSSINKKAIESYDWGNDALKDEVKFQLSLAFPIWRGIAGKTRFSRHLIHSVLGGNLVIRKNLRHFVKPTMNHRFLLVGH